jgi:hypothetical protein
MINITVEGRNILAARLQRLSPAIREAGRKRLGIIGEHLASWGRTHFEDSGLHVRSGDFRRSFAVMPVEEDEHSVRGGMLVGQKLPYPPVHEFGATITPKNAQMLAIPMEEALTPSGVQRFAPRDAEAAGYKTSVHVSPGGQVILFGYKDGVLYPLFLLVHSVTIPARPTVKPTLDNNREYIDRQLKEAVDEGIKESA